MNITHKKILSLVFLVALFSIPTVIFGSSFETDREMASSGLQDTTVYNIINSVLVWLLGIITLVAVIGFVVSGIFFITAGGSDRAEDAKKWLTYSIIGVIVALVGYIVIAFVDNILGGGASTTY